MGVNFMLRSWQGVNGRKKVENPCVTVCVPPWQEHVYWPQKRNASCLFLGNTSYYHMHWRYVNLHNTVDNPWNPQHPSCAKHQRFHTVHHSTINIIHTIYTEITYTQWALLKAIKTAFLDNSRKSEQNSFAFICAGHWKHISSSVT